MLVLDWSAIGLGLVIGGIASALFFAGLGLGMRLALRAARPVNILVLSGLVRIMALIGVGWGVAVWLGPVALAGFAAAFFIARGVVLVLARAGLPAGDAS